MVIDKALDDVIKEKFQARRNNRGALRGGINRGNFRQVQNLQRVQKNQVQYNNFRGGPNGGGMRNTPTIISQRGRQHVLRNRNVINRPAQIFIQRPTNHPNIQTINNLQRPVSISTGRQQAAANNTAGSRHNNLSAKIHISNLDFGVTEEDITELFSEFGPLKKVSMHYDKQGKSQGVCDIAYEQRGDALRAIKKYENVPLDGRKMRIEVVGALNDTEAGQQGMQTVRQRPTIQQRVMVQPQQHIIQNNQPRQALIVRNRNNIVNRARQNMGHNNRVNNALLRNVPITVGRNPLLRGAPGMRNQGMRNQPYTRGGFRQARGTGQQRVISRNMPRVNTEFMPLKRESLTEEQLDKQLDSYLAQAPI